MPLAGTDARRRGTVWLAYAAFVLVGVNAGVGGVLLAAQIRDYDVDKAVIGLGFVTSSAGFLLAGSTVGGLVHRLGTRTALLIGGGAFLLTSLILAARPPLVAFLLLQIGSGYAIGTLESVLNAHLATLPEPTGPLNRLHAFFGVGALVGPVLAAWLVGYVGWTGVRLVLGLLSVPLLLGFAMMLPRRQPAGAEPDGDRPAGLLRDTLRRPAVVLAAVFLSVYVGLEMSLGSWSFSFLVEDRGLRELLAGYAVTGYWLGLTLGRFVITPLGTRSGLGVERITYGCLAGIAAGAVLIWVMPGQVTASLGLFLLGLCLAPLFPTVMSAAPRLTEARLMPTAVGVMIGSSVIGGASLPWLAGLLAQRCGSWTLLPYSAGLALVLVAVWSPLARRLADPVAPSIGPTGGRGRS